MDEIREMGNKSYQERAFVILKKYLSDFTEDELKEIISASYGSNFDHEDITPLHFIDNNTACLELWHGPTCAFKDLALQMLPHLLTRSLKKCGETREVCILVATSGDTGKAALDGFADVDGTKIIVFYPDDGVSNVQKLQMVTQIGDNVLVYAVKGNFDDAQTGVKKMFTDADLAKRIGDMGYQFSSANSINIGRLVPQIAYYVYSYAKLVDNGEISNGDLINVCVPTGNFGNILAAYYAKNMGVPIAKLICASNENKVLYDFFKTGTYDKNRDFKLTNSPSMDILISSNLERLIHMCAGRDAKKNSELMNQLTTTGKYDITDDMKAKLDDFYGDFATQEETGKTIRDLYDKTGYIIDTHTAVAKCVYDKYVAATGDTTKTVIASTASPFKFTRSVMTAIDPKYDSWDDFDLVDELSKLGNVAIPNAIKEIRDANILHDNKCSVSGMEEAVTSFLK